MKFNVIRQLEYYQTIEKVKRFVIFLLYSSMGLQLRDGMCGFSKTQINWNLPSNLLGQFLDSTYST